MFGGGGSKPEIRIGRDPNSFRRGNIRSPRNGRFRAKRLGLRQSSAALGKDCELKSARGLAHSKSWRTIRLGLGVFESRNLRPERDLGEGFTGAGRGPGRTVIVQRSRPALPVPHPHARRSERDASKSSPKMRIVAARMPTRIIEEAVLAALASSMIPRSARLSTTIARLKVRTRP